MIPVVEEAMDYLDKGYGTRRVAEWLTDKTGKKISHQGIQNIWKAHRPNRPRVKELAKKNRKSKPKSRDYPALAALRVQRSVCKRLQTLNDKKLSSKRGPDTPVSELSGLPISPPTRVRRISYAVFCLKKKNVSIMSLLSMI